MVRMRRESSSNSLCSNVSGVEASAAEVEYGADRNDGAAHKLYGQSKYERITLKRGHTTSTDWSRYRDRQISSASCARVWTSLHRSAILKRS
jgi:hypothetical protein